MIGHGNKGITGILSVHENTDVTCRDDNGSTDPTLLNDVVYER